MYFLKEMCIRNYLKYNWIYVLLTILFAIFFTYLAIPILADFQWVKGIAGLVKNSSRHFSFKQFIGATSLILLLLILSRKKTQNIIDRFRNNLKLERPPFAYTDYIFWFIITVIFILSPHIIGFLPRMGLFMWLDFLLILGWILSINVGKAEDKDKNSINIQTQWFSDEPIKSSPEDILGREKFVDNLYEAILGIPFPDSFVFGLHRSWGEGKTSVINLLRNKFKGNRDFLLVNFDPWYFKDEGAILSALYDEIERTISEAYILPGVKETFMKYQKLISLGIAQAGYKMDFQLKGEGLKEVMQRIEEYILQINKKIFIIIDDIDRLHPNEILLVFKLVRLNTKFRNTVFLLSFDEIMVRKY